MINILIIWFIAGILLLIIPSLMYNSNTIGLSSFIVILLVGLLILVTSIFLIMKRNKVETKEFIKTLKNMFIISAVISVIIFLIGAMSYFFKNLFNIETQITNTMLAFGVLFVFSIISWVYITWQQYEIVSKNVSKVKGEVERIGIQIKPIEQKLIDDMEISQKALEDSNKIAEQNKKVLSERR